VLANLHKKYGVAAPLRRRREPSEVKNMNRPHHVNPARWSDAMGYARQSCARVFRQGGSPMDALAAFGLAHGDKSKADWGRTVERIAHALCAPGA